MISLKTLILILEQDYHKAAKDNYIASFRGTVHQEAEARMTYINYLMGIMGMKGFNYHGRSLEGSFTIHEIVKVDEKGEHIMETFEHGH